MSEKEKGGKPPFRIDFIPLGSATIETLKKNQKYCEDVPYVTRKTSNTRLAVVGSGGSIESKLEQLKSFDGDIWAINGACSWLAKKGIDSSLITVDSSQFTDYMLVDVKSAILASCAHPSGFDALKGKVEKFDLCEYSENGISGGCTTASRVPALAIYLGYTEITWFGCEGSYTDKDHVYGHYGKEELIIVKVGDNKYKTTPEMLLQCLSIAQLITAWPEIFKEQSGGLLNAIVNDNDTWEIIAVSEKVKEKIEEKSGKCGLYETPYLEN